MSRICGTFFLPLFVAKAELELVGIAVVIKLQAFQVFAVAQAFGNIILTALFQVAPWDAQVDVRLTLKIIFPIYIQVHHVGSDLQVIDLHLVAFDIKGLVDGGKRDVIKIPVLEYKV